MSQPNRLGNHLSMVPVCTKIRTSTIPRKKYGSAWKNVANGISQSVQEPRRHAMSVPTTLPPRKLSVVAMPSRTMVQGRYDRMRLPTGALSDQEWPRSPCARATMYCTYWSHMLVWTLKPSWDATAATHFSLQSPDAEARATATATGLPGTTRGKRKLTVIATHAATR